MFNAHVIFKQLGEGLGHDCYMDTVQVIGSVTILNLRLHTWAKT